MTKLATHSKKIIIFALVLIFTGVFVLSYYVSLYGYERVYKQFIFASVIAVILIFFFAKEIKIIRKFFHFVCEPTPLTNHKKSLFRYGFLIHISIFVFLGLLSYYFLSSSKINNVVTALSCALFVVIVGFLVAIVHYTTTEHYIYNFRARTKPKPLKEPVYHASLKSYFVDPEKYDAILQIPEMRIYFDPSGKMAQGTQKKEISSYLHFLHKYGYLKGCQKDKDLYTIGERLFNISPYTMQRKEGKDTDTFFKIIIDKVKPVLR